jgi:hypothetical protein
MLSVNPRSRMAVFRIPVRIWANDYEIINAEVGCHQAVYLDQIYLHWYRTQQRLIFARKLYIASVDISNALVLHCRQGIERWCN